MKVSSVFDFNLIPEINKKLPDSRVPEYNTQISEKCKSHLCYLKITNHDNKSLCSCSFLTILSVNQIFRIISKFHISTFFSKLNDRNALLDKDNG